MNAAPPSRLAAPRVFAPDQDFSLPEGRLVHLLPAWPSGPCPWQVQVRSGGVWLTWPGCEDDLFLSAGQAASLPAGAQALVQVEPRLAREAAVLRLVVATPAAGQARTGWAGLFSRTRRAAPKFP